MHTLQSVHSAAPSFDPSVPNFQWWAISKLLPNPWQLDISDEGQGRVSLTSLSFTWEGEIRFDVACLTIIATLAGRSACETRKKTFGAILSLDTPVQSVFGKDIVGEGWATAEVSSCRRRLA